MALTPIRITALRHSAFYSPLLYTIKSGLLQSQGLEPHYEPGTPSNPALEQVRNGTAHLSQLAVAASFAELEKGTKQPDIVHFAQINARDGFFLCRRGSGTGFDWRELENKKVLVDHLFQPLATIKYACHLKKVDYSRIQVVDAGDPVSMEQAFRDGQGDYVHLQGPAAQLLEHDGVGVVVASLGEALGPIAFSSLCARRSWLNSDMAKAFLRAYREGCRQTAETSPEKVAEVVQPFFDDIDRNVLVSTISTYQQMGWIRCRHWARSLKRDHETDLPVQVLEARCAPRLQHLDVQLPEHDPNDLENHLLQVSLTVFQLLRSTFGDTAVQALDGFVSRTGRKMINEMLERTISQSSFCPPSNYSSGEIGAIAAPAGVGSGAFLSVTLVLFMAPLLPFCTCRLTSHDLDGSTASNLRRPIEGASPDLDLQDFAQTPEQCSSFGTGCERFSRGLGWQPGVSPSLRCGILSGIAGTTLLFVYASVTPGILLSGSFTASGGSSDTRHMASLSMDNSLVQTWSVGSYFVFCAMLIFSVVWPYIKLLMMLYVWVRPIEQQTLGPLLVFLDQIGKWSLMDNIILFLFVVFFHIAWTGEDIVGGGQAKFGLKCSPEDELNTFLAATILSLLLGHAMLWIHRANEKTSPGPEEAVLQSGQPSSRRLRVIGAGHVVCFLLMVLSWQVEIVEVTFSGLVGAFLEVTQQETSKRYSILGILACLGAQGSMYLQVTFAVFVLAIPMLQLLAMTFFCLHQLRPKRRQQFLRLCYTLRAWAAYDVFLIAFLAAVLGGDRYGIGQFIESLPQTFSLSSMRMVSSSALVFVFT
ncbi:ytlA [Symbiodinium sp. CCMP2592]|nr:ytlA [Symbiodinium sp. CCMP2592]